MHDAVYFKFVMEATCIIKGSLKTEDDYSKDDSKDSYCSDDYANITDEQKKLQDTWGIDKPKFFESLEFFAIALIIITIMFVVYCFMRIIYWC